MPILLLLACLFIVLAVWLLLRSGQQWRQTGLPSGEVIYVDTGNWRRNDKPLYSGRYQLTGKPDYLIETKKELIPVEVKSTHLKGDDPYLSHKLQLAAYCLLVEDVLGVRPSHGILKYSNTTMRLPFSDGLRAELLDTLAAMRAAQPQRKVTRSHEDVARCVHCGYLQACGDSALV